VTARPGAGSLEELLESRSRRLRWVLLGLTLGFIAGLALYALGHEFPPHPWGLANDYRDFFAAATLIGRGVDPYHLGVLRVAEQAADAYPLLHLGVGPFVDPPVTAWALLPLAHLSFWVSFGVFTALSAVLVVITLTLLARDLGWRHTAILAAAALTSWIGLLGLVSGQFDALLFAALAGSMLLAWHERGLAAGCVLAVILLKPDLLWPAPIFLFLALWPNRARAWHFAAGFLGVALLFILASWSLLPSWWHALGHFAAGVGSRQPDLAGLPGLLRAAPASWGLGTGVSAPLTLLLVALALVTMAIFGAWMMMSPDWRRVSPVGRIAWAVALPVGIWLAATPYGHPNDDLLLLPLFMLTVGRDARRVHGLGLGLSAAAAAVLLLIWPAGILPWELGAAALVALTVLLWRRRTDSRLTGFGAGACVLALALLPPLWAFHTLAVGLTPLAVLVLVVEGGRTCWMEVGGAGTGPAYFPEPAPAAVAQNPAGA